MSGEPIAVAQRDDLLPVCPHCREDLRTIHARSMTSTFGRRFVYFCSQCRCVLGISHRKGFWMG